MTKVELLAQLEQFDDDALIVISFDATKLEPEITGLGGVAFDVDTVDDGWKPSNVAALKMGDLVMG